MGLKKELFSPRDLILLTVNSNDPPQYQFFSLVHVIYVRTIGRPSLFPKIVILIFQCSFFSLENSLHVCVATSVSI